MSWNNVCQKNFEKKLGPKHFWVQKIFESKEIWSKKMWCTNIKTPKYWVKKICQNRGSNNWDIADMDKCHQDISCLDKCSPYLTLGCFISWKLQLGQMLQTRDMNLDKFAKREVRSTFTRDPHFLFENHTNLIQICMDRKGQQISDKGKNSRQKNTVAR